jgi:hypothetical protein
MLNEILHQLLLLYSFCNIKRMTTISIDIGRYVLGREDKVRHG